MVDEEGGGRGRRRWCWRKVVVDEEGGGRGRRRWCWRKVVVVVVVEVE